MPVYPGALRVAAHPSREAIPNIGGKMADRPQVSLFPRCNSQSTVVQLPTSILKQLNPALPFDFTNPSLRILFTHLFKERLPEQSNPVFQSTFSLFQHRRPIEQRGLAHFQSMPL